MEWGTELMDGKVLITNGEPSPEISEADAWLNQHMCWCTPHEEARAALLAALELYDRSEADGCFIDYREPPNRYPDAAARGLFWAVVSMLDGMGLIEHSGSLATSSWLTPLGVEVRELLREQAKTGFANEYETDD